MTDSLEGLLIQVGEQAKEDWIKSQANIADLITDRLNDARDETIAKILGFDKDRFGRNHWVLDHCNGRSGNSFIGPEITDQAKRIVADCLNRVMDSFTVPEEVVAAARSEFAQIVQRELRAAAREKGKTVAKELVDKIAGDVLSGNLKG